MKHGSTLTWGKCIVSYCSKRCYCCRFALHRICLAAWNRWTWNRKQGKWFGWLDSIWRNVPKHRTFAERYSFNSSKHNCCNASNWITSKYVSNLKSFWENARTSPCLLNLNANYLSEMSIIANIHNTHID